MSREKISAVSCEQVCSEVGSFLAEAYLEDRVENVESFWSSVGHIEDCISSICQQGFKVLSSYAYSHWRPNEKKVADSSLVAWRIQLGDALRQNGN